MSSPHRGRFSTALRGAHRSGLKSPSSTRKPVPPTTRSKPAYIESEEDEDLNAALAASEADLHARDAGAPLPSQTLTGKTSAGGGGPSEKNVINLVNDSSVESEGEELPVDPAEPAQHAEPAEPAGVSCPFYCIPDLFVLALIFSFAACSAYSVGP